MNDVRTGATVKEVPESRSYVHSRCGQITEVDGGDFNGMAAPVPGVLKTMCASCGGVFPIAEFRWTDTNEDIPAYYARHRARVPALLRLLCSRQAYLGVTLLGLLAGIAVGIWSGFALGVVWGILIGIVCSLGGAVVGLVLWDAVAARALSRALGVADVRCLT